MSQTRTMTTHTSFKSNASTVRDPTPTPPIYDLRTYGSFVGHPSLPPPIDQPWSTNAHFYQGSALADTQLPSLQIRDQSIGTLPYVDLPQTGHSAQAFILQRYLEDGTAYFDPVVEVPRIRKQHSADSGRGLKKSNVSWLATCNSFGVVGDPKGRERLVAFGRVPHTETAEEKEEDEKWTRDWMMVSEVLPGGTIRRLMADSGDTIEFDAGCKSAKGDQ